MERKLECDIVRDLLPNYMEELTSERTNQSIKAHLKTCKECEKVYFGMNTTIITETTPEVSDLKKYLNKTKSVYGIMILLAIGILGILVTIIVDLAVGHHLSWSLIVIGGIIFAYAVGYEFITSERHKVIRALSCVSVLVLPYLALIEFVVNKFFMEEPRKWFISIALPITLTWLLILWVMVLFAKIVKNKFYVISVLLFFTLIGNFITNYIAGSYQSLSEYFEHFVSLGLGNLVAAVVFLILGMSRSMKGRMKKF